MRLIPALVCASALIAAPAWANLVTVTGNIAFACPRSEGFEPGCTPVEHGTMTFTYESNFYGNNISAFGMTVQQSTQPDLVFTLNLPRGMSLDTTGPDPILGFYVTAFWNFGSLLASAPLDFAVTGAGLDPSAPPEAGFWPTATAVSFTGAGVTAAHWLDGSFSATSVPTPAPEPGTMALLLAGIGAATVTRRRILKGRDEVHRS